VDEVYFPTLAVIRHRTAVVTVTALMRRPSLLPDAK